MEQHRRILGILFIVSSALTLLAALAVAGFMLFVGGMSLQDASAPEPQAAMFAVTAGITGCLFLLGLPGIITGVGLLKRQRWAKTWALVLGILSLPSFPLGTALGVYAIWFYTQPGSNQVFA